MKSIFVRETCLFMFLTVVGITVFNILQYYKSKNYLYVMKHSCAMILLFFIFYRRIIQSGLEMVPNLQYVDTKSIIYMV